MCRWAVGLWFNSKFLSSTWFMSSILCLVIILSSWPAAPLAAPETCPECTLMALCVANLRKKPRQWAAQRKLLIWTISKLDKLLAVEVPLVHSTTPTHWCKAHGSTKGSAGIWMENISIAPGCGYLGGQRNALERRLQGSRRWRARPMQFWMWCSSFERWRG